MNLFFKGTGDFSRGESNTANTSNNAFAQKVFTKSTDEFMREKDEEINFNLSDSRPRKRKQNKM